MLRRGSAEAASCSRKVSLLSFGLLPADEDAHDRAPDLESSLGEQLGRVRSAFSRLISAHVALLRAELGDIASQIKMLLAFGSVALVLLLTMANMLYVGGFLFMGEWLFGSMGWGLAHGVLFALSLALVLVMAMVGGSVRAAIASVVVTVVLIVVVAVALGSNVVYNAAASISAQLPAPINSAPAAGMLGGLVIVGLLFALLLARVGGRTGAIGGLVLGGLLGAILGLIVCSAPWTWPPAMGFAITIGLLAWPIINLALAWPIDVGARFSRLQPKQTIETITETREWLTNQWRSRLPTRGKK